MWICAFLELLPYSQPHPLPPFGARVVFGGWGGLDLLPALQDLGPFPKKNPKNGNSTGKKKENQTKPGTLSGFWGIPKNSLIYCLLCPPPQELGGIWGKSPGIWGRGLGFGGSPRDFGGSKGSLNKGWKRLRVWGLCQGILGLCLGLFGGRNLGYIGVFL